MQTFQTFSLQSNICPTHKMVELQCFDLLIYLGLTSFYVDCVGQIMIGSSEEGGKQYIQL